MKRVKCTRQSNNSKVEIIGMVSNDILNYNGQVIGYEVHYGDNKYIQCMFSDYNIEVLCKNCL